MSPGESGKLSFTLRNPYPWAMEDASLLVEIHEFRTGSEVWAVEELESPPILQESGSPRLNRSLGTIQPESSQGMVLIIQTIEDTPRGSVFVQGSYLIRFRLDFDYPPDNHAVMVSLGFYTAEEWAYASRDPTAEERQTYRYAGNANYSYLGQVLGLESIDGILPDTGFGVKEPLPLWPFYLLLVGAVGASLLSLYYLRREAKVGSKPINRRQR